MRRVRKSFFLSLLIGARHIFVVLKTLHTHEIVRNLWRAHGFLDWGSLIDVGLGQKLLNVYLIASVALHLFTSFVRCEAACGHKIADLLFLGVGTFIVILLAGLFVMIRGLSECCKSSGLIHLKIVLLVHLRSMCSMAVFTLPFHDLSFRTVCFK